MKKMKKLTMLLLVQLLAISLLAGCGAEDNKDGGSNKDKNATNESNDNNSNDNKNSIAPTDTITGLELSESFKFSYGSEAFITPYNNNIIINTEKESYIKDIYNNYNAKTMPFEQAEMGGNVYYGKDYLIYFMENNPTGEQYKDEHYLVVISSDGSSIYVDDVGIGLTANPHTINGDGNLVYVDNDNNLICIEPTTAKEIYRIELGEVYVSADDITKYFAQITYPENVNKIYNLSNGKMIFEAKVENHPEKNRYTKDIYLIEKNIVVQDWNEDATARAKHSVYDETGTLIYSNENPDEIPPIEQLGWNNSFLSVKRIDKKRYSAIYRADLTPVVEFHENNDSNLHLELLDFDSYYLDKACDSGISIYTSQYNNYGYIVTDTEAIQFTDLDIIHPGYDDWYVTYTDTENKRFLLNMANGVKFEILSAENSSDYSEIDQISPEVYLGNPSQAQTVFFSEATDTTTSVFDEKGNFLFSADNGKYSHIYGSIDMNKIIFTTDSNIIIYDVKTQKQTTITDEDVIIGNVLTVVKDKYLMYSRTNKETKEVTLKQINLEDNTITELVTAKNASFKLTNDFVIVYTSERDNYKNYDIYTYK